MVGAPATAAYARQGGTPTGRDVSYPQCGPALPSGRAFGIVAVNKGLPNNTNPCLSAEISWAEVSSGGIRQPKTSLYVNTANPGNHGISDWPATNNDPIFGKDVKDPYGTCRSGKSQACAWQYRWNMAELDARTRGVQHPGSYRWWLDVETVNSCESLVRNNRADLAALVLPEDPEQIPKAIAQSIWNTGCTTKFAWPIADHGLDRRLHRIQVPTLIVWGSRGWGARFWPL